MYIYIYMYIIIKAHTWYIYALVPPKQMNKVPSYNQKATNWFASISPRVAIHAIVCRRIKKP